LRSLRQEFDMPPPRPHWKGYLKLSLVTCPIALYSASSSTEKVAFRQINKKTGNRLKQQLIDEETGNVVDAADKGRGYEVDKGIYLRVDDEEIDAIAIESNHTIDIDRFVPKAQIDERYIDSPYYLIPNDKAGLDAYAVIRDAMHDKSMVALGRVVLSKRERVVMLQPWGKGLLGTTLRYPYEVRGEEAYFGDIPDVAIPKEMLALAEHILETKKADFDATQFHDRYEQAIVEMINVKKAGMPPSVRKQMVPRIVGGTDLMAALRQSIADDEAEEKAKAKPVAANANTAPKAKKPVKRNPDQREMLLPIAGAAAAASATKAKAAKEEPKKAAKATTRKAG
jgi:DNA end-binding protein Ku